MFTLHRITFFFFCLLCSPLLLATQLLAQSSEREVTGSYNGYLSQINIAECSLLTSQPANLNLTVRDRTGATRTTQFAQLPGYGTIHFVLNGLNGLDITDTYGTYTVQANAGTIYCHTAIYRHAAPGSPKSIEYAYSLPTNTPLRGISVGVFNSENPDAEPVPVLNWFSLVNSSPTALDATIELYGLAGNLIRQFPSGSLTPGERRDYALGHDRGREIGLFRVVPRDHNQQYSAQLIRYGLDGDRYKFAFPMQALKPTCDPGPIPASSMDPAANYGEVANINSESRTFQIEVRNQTGELLHQEQFTLAAFAQRHFPLHEYLGPRNVGSFRARCVGQQTGGVLSQSLFYGLRSESNPEVEWAYASQATGRSILAGQTIASPVNTFLGASNWNKYHEQSGQTFGLHVDVFSDQGTVSATDLPILPASGSLDYPFHERLPSDSVGLGLSSTTQTSVQYNSELLRVFYRNDGGIGYIMNIAGAVFSAEAGGDGSSSSSSSASSSSSSSGSSSSAAPPPPPLSLVPCPGFETSHVYPVSTFAHGQVCPRSDSVILFVSASDGDDNNTGRSPSAPLRRIDRALAISQGIRNVSVWILLRRADRFTISSPLYLTPSGPSADNPTVLSAYGSSLLTRPKILPARGVHGLNIIRGYNMTVSGIHIEQELTRIEGRGIGGTGYNMHDYLAEDGPYSEHYPHFPRNGLISIVTEANVVFEDNYVAGFSAGIINQGLSDPFGWNEFNPQDYPGQAAHVVFNGRSYIECARQVLTRQEQSICNRDNDFVNGDPARPILCQRDPDEDCDYHTDVDFLMGKIAVRGNVVVDNAGAGGHSQGMYTFQVENMYIENNVFDNNGWIANREVNGRSGNNGYATIFNHNLYLNSKSGPAVVRGNTIADASSHGIQARPGAIIERNLLLRNPLTLFVSKSSLPQHANFRSIVRHNVAMEGNDISSTLDRGFGIDHNAARHSLIVDNIIAHLSPTSGRYNNHALSINCESDRSYACETTFAENLVYNWSNSNGGGLGLRIGNSGFSLGQDDTLTITGNTFSNFGINDFAMMQHEETLASRVTISHNRYIHPTLPGAIGSPRALFRFSGQEHLYPAWSTSVEPTSTAQGSNPFPDPCRTVASYYYSQIQGSGQLSCSQIFDDNLYEAFMERSRQRSRFLDNTDTMAETVINYVRAGFGKAPLPPQ